MHMLCCLCAQHCCQPVSYWPFGRTLTVWMRAHVYLRLRLSRCGATSTTVLAVLATVAADQNSQLGCVPALRNAQAVHIMLTLQHSVKLHTGTVPGTQASGRDSVRPTQRLRYGLPGQAGEVYLGYGRLDMPFQHVHSHAYCYSAAGADGTCCAVLGRHAASIAASCSQAGCSLEAATWHVGRACVYSTSPVVCGTWILLVPMHVLGRFKLVVWLTFGESIVMELLPAGHLTSLTELLRW